MSASNSPLEIPSPPAALARIIAAASDPAVTKQELGQLVSNEPAFALRILNIVNSSLYRRGQKIASAQKAVSILGNRTLRNVALCAATQSCVQAEALGGFDLSLFWESSLQRAVGAQLWAQALGERLGVDPMEAFTAGLLQDLGLLALLLGRPDSAAAWMRSAKDSAQERREVEKHLFGCTHDDVGEQLVQTWKLPEELAIPIVWHHRIEAAPEEWTTRIQIAAAGEKVADILAHSDDPDALDQGRQSLMRLLDASSDEVDAVLGQVGDKVVEVAAALGVKVKRQPCLRKLLIQASEGLAEMNLSNESLLLSLERLLEEKELLLRELEMRNDALEQITLTDALTSLPNRRAFTQRLDAEIDRAAHGGSLALMLIDIDHFKSINDRFGHDQGDLVLTRVAAELVSRVPPGVMVARVGGEEFAAVLPQALAGSFAEVAQTLCASIRGLAWNAVDGLDRVTISLGLAQIKGPYDGVFELADVGRRLYRGADQALYHAKGKGRDRWIRVSEPIGWNLLAPQAVA